MKLSDAPAPVCVDCGFIGVIVRADGKTRCAKDYERWRETQ